MHCRECIHFLVCNRCEERKNKADGCNLVEKEIPRAFWLEQCDGTHFCSECGFDALYERYDDLAFREKLTDVCHHCGAIMGGENDED